MISRPNGIYCRRAFILLETVISIVVLIIVIIGTSTYRYYAAMEVRRSDVQVTAARVGLLLFEGWRGTNGSDTYDPTVYLGSDLAITQSTGHQIPGDFVLLAGYRVRLDDVDYYAALSWKDVQPGLRALNVVVSWPQRGQTTYTVADTDKLFSLTGYVAN